MTKEMVAELYNLYHIARTALSGTGAEAPYDRKLWASSQFSLAHPDISPTRAYKAFERTDAGWSPDRL